MIHQELIFLSVCVCVCPSALFILFIYLSIFSFLFVYLIVPSSFSFNVFVFFHVFRINIPLALFYLKFKISATSNLKFKIINLKIALNRKTVRCSNEECTNTRTDREKNKDKASKNVLFLRTF